jgi:hypothetical protein
MRSIPLAMVLGALLPLAACGDDDDGGGHPDSGQNPGADGGMNPDGGGTPDANPNCNPVSGEPTLAFAEVANGMSEPTSAVVAPGGRRIFVTERPGRIRIIDENEQLIATPFLDITAIVNDGGSEQGLLGLAFHPQYAQNGRFFVYYIIGNRDIKLAEYKVSADPNIADAGSGVEILTVPHPMYSNHNGGWLAFGPDGHLYMGTGDGGLGGDPFDAGQDLTDLRGKLLRLDVSTPGQYAVPADNPFVGMPGGVRGEIWAYGLRNCRDPQHPAA